MKMIQRISALLIVLVSCLNASAQSSTAKASIDSTHIEMGRQIAVHIDLMQPEEKVLTLQLEPDTAGKIEFVKTMKADTAKEGMFIHIKQDVIITAFDSGSFTIPAMKYIDNQTGALIETNTLQLDVDPMQVDMNDESVKDIKDIMDVPFDWKRFFMWVGILALVGIIGFLAWKYGRRYWMKLRQKKDGETGSGIDIVEEIRPADAIALERLEIIKQRRDWIYDERRKDFYLELTDTLRDYFCSRFSISAMEMTSDEILDTLKYNVEANPIMDKLKPILRNADFAKFAKINPTEDACETDLVNAFFIVNKTAKVETLDSASTSKEE